MTYVKLQTLDSEHVVIVGEKHHKEVHSSQSNQPPYGASQLSR